MQQVGTVKLTEVFPSETEIKKRIIFLRLFQGQNVIPAVGGLAEAATSGYEKKVSFVKLEILKVDYKYN